MSFDDPEGSVDVIPNSYCVYCGGSGTTRLLIHKIPYFREIILASFSCEWSPDQDNAEDEELLEGGGSGGGCGYTNNEVTFGGVIQAQGCCFELQCRSKRDLDRQLIKSDSATVRIPALQFEIPPMTQVIGVVGGGCLWV